MRRQKKSWLFIKACLFLLSLAPFLSLLQDTIQNQLGANPIESLHFRLGDWALRFLCLGLALTPLRRVIKQSWPLRLKRMIGLFTFFYASLHLAVYIILDLSLSWKNFIDEVPQSPYILVGLFTYLLLLPLAFTSTKTMQKYLGKHWKQLHKLIYIAGISAVTHYFWLVKSDLSSPLFYAALLFILLFSRLLPSHKIKNKRTPNS